jgi:hypothetical protein
MALCFGFLCCAFTHPPFVAGEADALCGTKKGREEAPRVGLCKPFSLPLHPDLWGLYITLRYAPSTWVRASSNEMNLVPV